MQSQKENSTASLISDLDSIIQSFSDTDRNVLSINFDDDKITLKNSLLQKTRSIINEIELRWRDQINEFISAQYEIELKVLESAVSNTPNTRLDNGVIVNSKNGEPKWVCPVNNGKNGFIARYQKDGETINIGTFDSKIEAGKAISREKYGVKYYMQ